MSKPTMTRDEVLREFGYCGWCEAGICSGDDNKMASHNMADIIVSLREQLEAVTQDARRYQLLRALLRHSRWNDVDAIHEMKPEFEKYINDADLDTALDCVINFEMEK